MAQATEPGILVRIDQRKGGARIAYLTIHNPRKLNTLTSRLMNDFAGAIEGLAGEATLRALVLTGAGDRAFIGGADIDEMAGLDSGSAGAFISRLHRCCDALRKLPVPVIGRIQGYALGAGLEIAAACDLRVAADTAQFGMPEVRLGIPSVIEAALLPALVGWGRARQILLLGEDFTAVQAEAWGLIERVVPMEKLDDAVESLIQSLLQAGPRAVRLQKKLIQAWEDLPLSAAVEAGVAAFVSAWETDEPRQMMTEFQAARRRRNSM